MYTAWPNCRAWLGWNLIVWTKKEVALIDLGRCRCADNRSNPTFLVVVLSVTMKSSMLIQSGCTVVAIDVQSTKRLLITTGVQVDCRLIAGWLQANYRLTTGWLQADYRLITGWLWTDRWFLGPCLWDGWRQAPYTQWSTVQLKHYINLELM